ncbi:MAG: 30S ribosomal protein S6 [Clostridia bacterium]|jgi:small subunit ribosomal protein S6|nr:30S ribosomal protein S6 [Clostridia bacterium]
MNEYETIFIINNEITDNEKRKVISKIEELITNNGKITKVDNLGTRKLAYEIKKQKVGYYCLIEFNAKPNLICELERLFRITEDVLKFIVVRKED